MNHFEQNIQEWERLHRQDKKQADEYYWRDMFPEVIHRFCQRGKELKNYRYLISLVGFSPATSILFIKCINPEKVMFIYSDETEKHLDDIHLWTGLKLSQLDKRRINSSDVADVYEAIKEFVAGKNYDEILIDITGGKKSMVGGASMAGNLLGIDTGYIDYERYIPDLRQPEPGSEYPNILKNPLTIFGDLEIEKAKEAFNDYNFARAIDTLTELEDKTKDIRKVRYIRDLVSIYHCLDHFEFDEAKEKIDSLFNRYKDEIGINFQENLRSYQEIIDVLSGIDDAGKGSYRALHFFFSSLRFAKGKRYDVAVFLIYRVIELILASTLKYNERIDPQNPQYGNVSEESYNLKSKEIFEKDYYHKMLPRKIGLMDSAIILSILKNGIAKDLDLKKLRSIVSLRNESNFTHGFKNLTEDDFNKIRREGRKLLEKYLKIHGKGDVKSFEGKFVFPPLQ